MCQIIPFLDEFLVHDQYYNNMLMMSISIQSTIETHKKIEYNFKKKEGVRCYDCYKINKWLKPDKNLDYDEERDYCSCNYMRNYFGDRISRQDYYSK